MSGQKSGYSNIKSLLMYLLSKKEKPTRWCRWPGDTKTVELAATTAVLLALNTQDGDAGREEQPRRRPPRGNQTAGERHRGEPVARAERAERSTVAPLPPVHSSASRAYTLALMSPCNIQFSQPRYFSQYYENYFYKPKFSSSSSDIKFYIAESKMMRTFKSKTRSVLQKIMALIYSNMRRLVHQRGGGAAGVWGTNPLNIWTSPTVSTRDKYLVVRNCF